MMLHRYSRAWFTCRSSITFAAYVALYIALSAAAAAGESVPGFIIEGIDTEDLLGSNGSISEAGDINGDGIDDVIVAARQGDPGGRIDAGEAFVVFGRIGAFPSPFEVSHLLPENGGDGTEGFVILGADLIDFLGDAVSGAGDVNADGLDDIIVGAEGADPGGNAGSGESYVIFGRNT